MLCREHGLQITELARSFDIPYCGIVKEVSDVNGLAEFQHDYFGSADLYRDVELRYYEAFGNQTITLFPTWNPIQLYKGFSALGKRMKEKNIKGNLKGEGLVKGGILVFDQGELKYAEEEAFGVPLDMDALRKVLEEIFSTKETAKEEL